MPYLFSLIKKQTIVAYIAYITMLCKTSVSPRRLFGIILSASVELDVQMGLMSFRQKNEKYLLNRVYFRFSDHYKKLFGFARFRNIIHVNQLLAILLNR